ncbi:MAG: MFS transporter [Candidatus Thorarchaeota archaeon]|jgi:GPH family glycoside/pentoside/hexuronide:cation symporter
MEESPSRSEREDQDTGVEGQRHSRFEIWSFSSMFLGVSAVSMLIISRLIYFYQVAVGLAIWMITIGYTLYSIWDAINDPIIGHLSDRNNRLTRRWGKRYPWIIFSGVPLAITMILVFTPPDIAIADGLATFLWFVIILLLFDTLFSTFTVNFTAQLPNKYRRIDERTAISSIAIVFRTIGTLIAFVLPIAFFVTPLATNPEEYIPVAIIAGVLFLAVMVCSRPGVREDESMITSYFIDTHEQQSFHSEFMRNLRIAFGQRSYILVLVVVIAINIANLLTIPMLPYFINYVIEGVNKAFYEMIMWLLYIAGGAVMIPIGYVSCRRYGNYNVWKVSLIITGCSYLLLFMAGGDAILSLLCVFIIGALISLANISYIITLADFYDEVAVKHEKRQEGIYSGLFVVFSRFARIIALFLIASIQTLTLFDPMASTQLPLAQFGILFTLTVIPGIAFIIAGLVIWRLWILTPDRVVEIKGKLRELGI